MTTVPVKIYQSIVWHGCAWHVFMQGGLYLEEAFVCGKIYGVNIIPDDLFQARGPKKHLKRIAAPKHWMLDKLGGVFVS